MNKALSKYTDKELREELNRRRESRFLTFEEVRRYFEYREDGVLVWKEIPQSKGRPNNYHLVGKVASTSTKSGYKKVKIKGVEYPLHKLIWFWHTGEIWSGHVDFVIDHINNDRADNRIENLRKATNSQNGFNKRTLDINNVKLGTERRVRKDGTVSYQSRLRTKNGNLYLGMFETQQEAHDVWLAKRRELYGSEFENSSGAT